MSVAVRSKPGSALFYQAGGALPIASHASGCFIWDNEGNRYLDACSGAITCNLGHNHPAVIAAMTEQLGKIAFAYRTQFENQPAIDLADALVNLTQGALERVFFVGSGSEAVESAMKLACQFFRVSGDARRTRFVSLRPSYHGSTLGALGLTGYLPLERPFADLVQGSIKVPGPDFYRREQADENAHVDDVLLKTRRLVEAVGPESVIGVVIEPVGGASTGARLINSRYYDGLKRLCEEWGCLFILDEVLSGMGRTGEWFGYQHFGEAPDIVALAKGLGSGYYPVGAVLARAEIVDPIIAGGGFMHGHTYAGNPLACATGLAVLNAMKDEDILAQARIRGLQLRAGLESLQHRHAIIGDVRGVGLLQAFELVEKREGGQPFPAHLNLFAKLTELARERHGLLIYPRRTLNGIAGDHFLVAPPLNISEAEVDMLISLLDAALHDLRASLA